MTQRIISEVTYLGTVESTQDIAKAHAKQLVLSDQPLGFPRQFYVAESQTGGRGQHGRQWSSPDGGIYLSAVVPDVPQYMHRYLPLISGLAIARLLMRPWFPSPWLPGPPKTDIAFTNVHLRWPNDVLFNGRKIAGVLSESVTMGHRAVAVIGVGMNVNADPAASDSVLSQTATSLAHEIGGSVDKVKVTNAMLHNMEECIGALTNRHWPQLHQEICHLDFLRGRAITVAVNDQCLYGTGAGIADDGALLLALPSQREPQAIYAGTIVTIDNRPIRPVE